QNSLVKKWDKSFGGGNDEWLSNLQVTNDGGFILGGFTNSTISGDVTQNGQGYGDYWVLKTDSLGNKMWDKRFGGNADDWIFSLQQTTDRGFILGGVTNSDSSGDVSYPSHGTDFWLIKTDSLGNKKWDKRFWGNVIDELLSLQQTTDGGYILGGFTTSDSSGDISEHTRGEWDYWILKIDSLGNKIWDKRFGGNKKEQLFSLQQTLDGGYILGGWTNSDSSGEVSQLPRGGRDYWILKTDSLGNKQWDKRYGGLGDDYFYSLQQIKDSEEI
ncbi:MAG: type sorting protein, partial [Bacteroidetes bacterium]|nr:type sorting protein [Bacteroidota bacterium]